MKKFRFLACIIAVSIIGFTNVFMSQNLTKISNDIVEQNLQNLNSSSYFQNYFSEYYATLAFSGQASVLNTKPGITYQNSSMNSSDLKFVQNFFSETVENSVKEVQVDPNIQYTMIRESGVLIAKSKDDLSTIKVNPTLSAKYRWYGIVSFDKDGNVTPEFFGGSDPESNQDFADVYQHYTEELSLELKDQVNSEVLQYAQQVESSSISQSVLDESVVSNPTSVTVIIAIPKVIEHQGNLYESITLNSPYSDSIVYPYLAFLGLACIVGGVVITLLLRKDSRFIKATQRMRIEIALILSLILLGVVLGITSPLITNVANNQLFIFQGVTNSPFEFLATPTAHKIIAGLYWTLITSLGLYLVIYYIYFFANGFFRSLRTNSIIVNLIESINSNVQNAIRTFMNRPRFIVAILCILADALIGFFAYQKTEFFFLYALLNLGILFAFVLYFIHLNGEYKRLVNLTENMAEGDFETLIQTDTSELKILVDALNHVQVGFEKSLKEEISAQRQKTELITNVSHDLKTPLTTILTYIELLEQDNISEEDRERFNLVLKKNAIRLKTLIDDLFVVTEVNNGISKISLDRIDIVALLQQVQADVAHIFEARGLNVRLTISERPIMVDLDGQKTSRIFENILGNIAKYALQDSRVYIDINKYGDFVKVEFKNIANYEMKFDSESIYERFVQGDESRNTEGSGLGLAIVKSLVELQDGTFEVKVDGDLFKAILIFKVPTTL